MTISSSSIAYSAVKVTEITDITHKMTEYINITMVSLFCIQSFKKENERCLNMTSSVCTCVCMYLCVCVCHNLLFERFSTDLLKLGAHDLINNITEA